MKMKKVVAMVSALAMAAGLCTSAAADGGDLRMSILTSEWKKTESDLDNRTGRLQRILHSPCF